jgi:Cystatin domain
MNAKPSYALKLLILLTVGSANGCGKGSMKDLNADSHLPDSEVSLPGGFSSISISSREAIAAAEFAVSEQSKRGPTLKLSSIESAKTQVVAGTNVDLELTVLDGAVEKAARARVYNDLSQKQTLSTWVWK